MPGNVCAPLFVSARGQLLRTPCRVPNGDQAAPACDTSKACDCSEESPWVMDQRCLSFRHVEANLALTAYREILPVWGELAARDRPVVPHLAALLRQAADLLERTLDLRRVLLGRIGGQGSGDMYKACCRWNKEQIWTSSMSWGEKPTSFASGSALLLLTLCIRCAARLREN